MQQPHRRQKMTISSMLVLLVVTAAAATPSLPLESEVTPDRLLDSLPASDEEEVPAVDPTTEAPNNLTIYQDQFFQLHRDLAIQLVLGKVLRALGPKFKERLPTAPTNATLTDLNSTLNMETHSCPSYYTRCSSQTFYPSCEVPNNTDELMWSQRFTLFFNISSEISSIHRDDLLAATLRLYKNLSLPLDNPRTLIIKLHAFTRSLRRNRERSVTLTSTRVASDYVGWVFMDVARLVRRLKGRSNYGVKISVQNENNVPWNIPDLFVKMDCAAYNETLIPLPFEIQLDENTKKYPAFNIRSGTQESSTNNDDYLNFYGQQNRAQPENSHSSGSRNTHHHNNINNNHNNRRHRQQGGLRRHWGDNSARNNNNQHYNGNHPNLNQRHTPHVYDSQDNREGIDEQDTDNGSNFVAEEEALEEDLNSDDIYYDQQQQYPPNGWSASGSYNEPYHQGQVNRPQPRYKKQSPVFSTHHNSNSPHYSPNQQQYEERPFYSQENQNADHRPSISQENQNDDSRPFYSQENQNDGNSPFSREYQNFNSRYSSQEDLTSTNHRRQSHRLNTDGSRHEAHHDHPRRYSSRENSISDDARLISGESPNTRAAINDADYDSALDDSSSHPYNADHNGSDYNSNYDYYPDYNSDHYHSHRQGNHQNSVESHRLQHNRHNGGHRHHSRHISRRGGGSSRRHRQQQQHLYQQHHHQQQQPFTELPAVYDDEVENNLRQVHGGTGSAENRILSSDTKQAT